MSTGKSFRKLKRQFFGKLLGVKGEKRLMGVWKEMGWDGMNMELAEKIYKRKVGPQRLACACIRQVGTMS